MRNSDVRVTISCNIIYSTGGAFAAVLKDGAVVIWSVQDYGGDSRTVQAALIGVDTIYSTHRAFAAVLKDNEYI